MPSLPTISDAEWDVMKVLWESPAPLTAGDLVKRLESHTDWAPRTIKTLLARLVKKNAARVDVIEGRHLYRAAVTRDACRREESRSFLARVFDGQAAPAVMHLLTETKLTPNEIEDLKRILDRKSSPDTRR